MREEPSYDGYKQEVRLSVNYSETWGSVKLWPVQMPTGEQCGSCTVRLSLEGAHCRTRLECRYVVGVWMASP